jgi:hypothetical protein
MRAQIRMSVEGHMRSNIMNCILLGAFCCLELNSDVGYKMYLSLDDPLPFSSQVVAMFGRVNNSSGKFTHRFSLPSGLQARVGV